MSATEAIVLAGGKSSRFGADKAFARLEGQTLLGRTVSSLANLGFTRIAIAAPPEKVAVVGAETGVSLLAAPEDPPGGGPVAGIFAGLVALDQARADGNDEDAAQVAVLACDHPGAATVLSALLKHAEKLPPCDGVCASEDGERPQWLLAIYRLDFLRARQRELGDGRGVAAKNLFAPAKLLPVRMNKTQVADVDRPGDLENFLRQVRESNV